MKHQNKNPNNYAEMKLHSPEEIKNFFLGACLSSMTLPSEILGNHTSEGSKTAHDQQVFWQGLSFAQCPHVQTTAGNIQFTSGAGNKVQLCNITY